MSDVTKDILFIRGVLDFLAYKTIDLPIVLYCDNTGAIFLSKNPQSRRIKHLDYRYHFVRDYVDDGTILPAYVPTEENLADPMTKNTSRSVYDSSYPYMKRSET